MINFFLHTFFFPCCKSACCKSALSHFYRKYSSELDIIASKMLALLGYRHSCTHAIGIHGRGNREEEKKCNFRYNSPHNAKRVYYITSGRFPLPPRFAEGGEATRLRSFTQNPQIAREQDLRTLH